jgi:hypothetical protein
MKLVLGESASLREEGRRRLYGTKAEGSNARVLHSLT